MKHLIYIILFFSAACFAQQTAQFTQFTFNKYGYNPAAAGTNINGGLEVITGARKQWIGYPNAPATNFFSANYTFKPERSYKRWHNAGVYLVNDKSGIFQSFSIYGSYTLHLPLTNKLNMSVGIFAGVRRFSIAKGAISEFDPVYAASSSYFLAYPDFIPGIRLYNKKMFFDISVQQTYKNRQVQGDKQIGNKSVLTPHAYISLGRKINYNNGFTVVPAVNIHGTFTGIPSAEINLMAYYRSRIGLGASIRSANTACAILQVRIFKNMTAGFAYDYTINKFNSAYANTLEFMVGITPMLTSLIDKKGNHNVAKCPNFDF